MKSGNGRIRAGAQTIGLRNWLLMDMLIAEKRNGGISMLYDLNEKENRIYEFICD